MKGISNVITAVLLLGVAVTLATLYSTWAPQLAEDLTQDSVDNANNEIKCRNAGLAIKNPVYYTSANETTFEVINTGTIRFTDSVDLIAIKGSLLNETSINGLEVEETVSDRIYSPQKPNMIVASTSECPSLRVETTQISTGN